MGDFFRGTLRRCWRTGGIGVQRYFQLEIIVQMSTVDWCVFYSVLWSNRATTRVVHSASGSFRDIVLVAGFSVFCFDLIGFSSIFFVFWKIVGYMCAIVRRQRVWNSRTFLLYFDARLIMVLQLVNPVVKEPFYPDCPSANIMSFGAASGTTYDQTVAYYHGELSFSFRKVISSFKET